MFSLDGIEMAVRFIFVMAVAVFIARPTSADEKQEHHSWSEIVYPSIPCDWATKYAVPSFRVPGENERQGLQFCLTFFMPRLVPFESKGEFTQPETKKIDVRLHLADGTIVEPKADDSLVDLGIIWSSRGPGVYKRTFDWQKNDFQEAWIELRFPGYAYWLEIPYGFTRNPKDPLCRESSSGEPRFAPAMKVLEKNAKLVNWKYVEYDFDDPNLHQTLRQSNPFDAKCELILYKEYSEGGWDLFSPRSSISIQQKEDGTLRGDCRSITKHDDGWRRSDHFKFPRNPASPQRRNWGMIVITVGEAETELVVPSSLFKYVHGVTDPYHEATIRE